MPNPTSEWSHSPSTGPHEGYVYVLGFSTGGVKVGNTRHPVPRLGKHRYDADAFGVEVERTWISVAHSRFVANEQSLIRFCEQASHKVHLEYFPRANFDTVVQFAAKLDFSAAPLVTLPSVQPPPTNRSAESPQPRVSDSPDAPLTVEAYLRERGGGHPEHFSAAVASMYKAVTGMPAPTTYSQSDRPIFANAYGKMVHDRMMLS